MEPFYSSVEEQKKCLLPTGIEPSTVCATMTSRHVTMDIDPLTLNVDRIKIRFHLIRSNFVTF